MSSLNLTIDFTIPYDDEPWTFEYKTVDVLNDYLQPQSQTSPSAAALQLNELLPKIGILQLWDIVFRVAAQVPHDHPSQDKLVDLVAALRDAPIRPNPFAELDQLNGELTDIFHQTSADPPRAEQVGDEEEEEEDDDDDDEDDDDDAFAGVENLYTAFGSEEAATTTPATTASSAEDSPPAAVAAAERQAPSTTPTPTKKSRSRKNSTRNSNTQPLHDGHSFRNLHALSARLTRARLDDRAGLDGAPALAWALEQLPRRPHPRSRAYRTRGAELNWRIPIAAGWIEIAGREVYECVGAEDGGGGRWEVWKERFEDVAEEEGVCEESVREVARVAARRMREIEREVGGGGGGGGDGGA